MTLRWHCSIAVFAISAIVLSSANGAPLETNSLDDCTHNAPKRVLEIMRRKSTDAQRLCEARRVPAGHSATTTELQTVTVAENTITSTVHASPTITITVAKDYITTVTVTDACENEVRSVGLEKQSGKRDSQLARLLANVAPMEIKSACACFMADKTATATVMGSPTTDTQPTVTQAYTMMDGDPVISSYILGATRTAYKTICS